MDHGKQNWGSFGRGSVWAPIRQYVLLITLKPWLFKLLSGGELDRGRGGGTGTFHSDIVRMPKKRQADGEIHIIWVIIRRKWTESATISNEQSDFTDHWCPFPGDGKLMAALYIPHPPSCRRRRRRNLPSAITLNVRARHQRGEIVFCPGHGS